MLTYELSQWSQYVIQAHINSYSKEIFFYSKNKVLTYQLTNHSIVKPAKAPIQFLEGYWFEPTHGFYTFLCYFYIFSIFKRLPQHFREETRLKQQ